MNSGKLKISSGETFLYSGHTEERAPHTEGVGLMMTEEAERALVAWEAGSPRIITATFSTKQKRINVPILQCYAPTNEADDEKKRYLLQPTPGST